MALRRANSGLQHPATAAAIAGLARTLAALGDFERACENFAEALALRRVVLGAHHPKAMEVAHDYALALRRKGELDACHALLLETLEHRARQLGEAHPHTVKTASALEEVECMLQGVGGAASCGGGLSRG